MKIEHYDRLMNVILKALAADSREGIPLKSQF